MDPPIAFPSDWYPVAAVVLSGVLVAMVTTVVSWKLLSWIRGRKRRYHEPLLSDGWTNNEGKKRKILGKLFNIFYKDYSEDDAEASIKFDDNNDPILKRSSTVHSRTSLISTGSSSRASSIPPLIIQNCQPSDIYIPERRQSSFSVESGGVELGHVQADCYKSELSETDSQLKTKPGRSMFGVVTSSINEAAEDGEVEEIIHGKYGEDNDDKEAEEEEEDGSEPEENSAGSLMFSLEHDMHRESLTVTVIKAIELRYIIQQSTQSETSSSSSGGREPLTGQTVQGMAFDPYVRILILPDGKQKAKTRIVRKTRNPVFEETFTFYGIGSQKLTQTVIKFSMLNHDRFAKDGLLGQVVLPLSTKLMKRDRHAITLCRKISTPHQSIMRQGELFISLNFEPSADKMTVIVLKGRNFPRMDISGLADPYVKVYVTCDGQRVDKRKTQIKKRTLSPVFNETFHFNLPQHHQHRQGEAGHHGGSDYSNIQTSVQLKFLVFDWDRVSKNEVIGRVEIGSNVASEVAVKHWNDVMECPRKQLAVWHKLE